MLIVKHKKKMREQEGSSGTVDNETELDNLLPNIIEETKTALEDIKNNKNMKRMQRRRRKFDKMLWKVCQKLEKGSATMKHQERREITAHKP